MAKHKSGELRCHATALICLETSFLERSQCDIKTPSPAEIIIKDTMSHATALICLETSFLERSQRDIKTPSPAAANF